MSLGANFMTVASVDSQILALLFETRVFSDPTSLDKRVERGKPSLATTPIS